MLTLLLGPDDFSKKLYILELASNAKAGAVFFDAENPPMAENLMQSDLFSRPGIFVLRGLVAKYNSAEIAEKLIASKNQIVIVEEKLDKRLANNKALLANKKITVKEFILPHGKELDAWINQRVKILNGKISGNAVNLLALKLGRDKAKETKFGGKVTSVEEIYNLWQAESEIQKLIAYAGGREITAEDVEVLVMENGEVDVFDLTNAIAENQKQKTWQLLRGFLSQQTGSDEKASVIQLNALLGEQFRNVAMIQDFTAIRLSDSEILEKTGWKSGRLFVIKKIAGKFPPKKITDLLHKLAALDEELKTSQTPPQVLLDLIISQLLA